MSSEVQTEQTGIGSYRPRVGQKKRVLVCPVDQVDSFNEFWFTPSTGSTILTIAALSHEPCRVWQEAERFLFGQIFFTFKV